MKRLAFSDDMMRAIAAGSKTMTRRPEKRLRKYDFWKFRPFPPALFGGKYGLLKPRFFIGDLVAATCAFWPNDSGERYPEADYRFVHPDWEAEFGKANPARVMPAALAPFILWITEVRAERLGQITDADAEREGAVWWGQAHKGRQAFECLWNHIYGAGEFERNSESWVWVYGFEVVERRTA
jgi:hypothetical protein